MRIKDFRKLRGITQEEFAKSLGITPCTLSRYENGSREPGIAIIVKMAELLNIPMEDLVADGEAEETEPVFAEAEKETGEKIIRLEVAFRSDGKGGIEMVGISGAAMSNTVRVAKVIDAEGTSTFEVMGRIPGIKSREQLESFMEQVKEQVLNSFNFG